MTRRSMQSYASDLKKFSPSLSSAADTCPSYGRGRCSFQWILLGIHSGNQDDFPWMDNDDRDRVGIQNPQNNGFHLYRETGPPQASELIFCVSFISIKAQLGLLTWCITPPLVEKVACPIQIVKEVAIAWTPPQIK